MSIQPEAGGIPEAIKYGLEVCGQRGILEDLKYGLEVCEHIFKEQNHIMCNLDSGTAEAIFGRAPSASCGMRMGKGMLRGAFIYRA